MFNNLIESTANVQQKTRRSAYFGIATVFYTAVFLTVFVWSTFSFNLSNLADADLSLNTLVSPVVVPENHVPPPMPTESQPTKALSAKESPKNFDVLRDPVESIENATKPPKGISTENHNSDTIRRDVPFVIGDKPERASFDGEPRRDMTNSQPPIPLRKNQRDDKETEDTPPPPAKPKQSETETIAKKPAMISKGVINGIALNLPKPVYSPAAKAIHASGAVQIQVTIDENGNVVSAKAISGHPLLRPAAQDAAQKAKFTPTKLSDQPVKVTGIIVYNFLPQ